MTDLLSYADPLRRWLIAAGIALVLIGAAWVTRNILIRRLEGLAARTTTDLDNAIVDMLKATRLWLIAVVAAALALHTLELTDRVRKLLDAAATLALFVQAGLWATSLWGFWLRRSRARALKSNASAAATSLSAMGFIGELILWTVIALLALDNLGFNITTLIAGLGVGGIAVALAVQNILGDLFASLSIVIDKPFVIGDFIIVDNYMGTVENVGLKTTRIRSLGGEQIIVANSDLLNNRIRNYKRMYERRIVFGFGVLYQTPSDALEQIPALVRAIIEGRDKVRFDRAHCSKFGDSSIDFEVVYWVTDPDYNLYMDIQQAINFELKRSFEARNVEFAFPTRTIVVQGPLDIRTAARDGDTAPPAPRS